MLGRYQVYLLPDEHVSYLQIGAAITVPADFCYQQCHRFRLLLQNGTGHTLDSRLEGPDMPALIQTRDKEIPSAGHSNCGFGEASARPCRSR